LAELYGVFLIVLANLIDGLKLGAAEMLWSLPRRQVADERLENARQTLLSEGCYAIENFLDSDQVDALAVEAKRAYEIDPAVVSLESNGADRRIYGVDRLCPEFSMQETMGGIDTIAAAFYGKESITWFQVLGSIAASERNLGSGSGWHRDSPFSHQFKAILYLCDVSIENGPFEYCMGSHLRTSVHRVAQHLGIPPRQYRFTAEQIQQIETAGVVQKRSTLTARKGTLLLIDSRGLHRGKPLVAGERLAVTRYYFSGGVPTEFATRYPLTAQRQRAGERRAA
jgi:hypothetical protein